MMELGILACAFSSSFPPFFLEVDIKKCDKSLNGTRLCDTIFFISDKTKKLEYPVIEVLDLHFTMQYMKVDYGYISIIFLDCF